MFLCSGRVSSKPIFETLRILVAVELSADLLENLGSYKSCDLRNIQLWRRTDVDSGDSRFNLGIVSASRLEKKESNHGKAVLAFYMPSKNTTSLSQAHRESTVISSTAFAIGPVCRDI